jgi:hypothetical protein
MANYAFLNENNVVIQVIEGPNEGEVREGISDWEAHYAESFGSTCKRVNIEVHKNNAAVDYLFDEQRNAFIPPKPFESWVLNEETCQWNTPTPMPTEGGPWIWVETDLSWQVDSTEYQWIH